VDQYLASLPKNVVLVVKTTPPMAEVSLAGGRVLGLTPLTYRTKSTTDTWKLKVSLDGHVERTIKVVADRDRSLELVLVKKAKPAADAGDDKPEKATTTKRTKDRRKAEPRSRRRRRRPRERPRKTGMRKYDSVRTVDPFD